MKIPFVQIDAFSATRFTGNPAAVCLFEDHGDGWPDGALLQAIAGENNLSETAFVLQTGSARWPLRWFTPTVEVSLCGHATLAAAAALQHWGHVEQRVVFTSRSGPLEVVRQGERLEMNFPAVPLIGVADAPEIAEALGLQPVALHRVEPIHGARYFLAELEDEAAVRSCTPNFAHLEALGANVVVTARGDAVDVVSRFFGPGSGVPEDPVTGSAHCTLGPYWQGRLGPDLRCRQLSARGGELWVRVAGDRVYLSGDWRLVIEGRLHCGRSAGGSHLHESDLKRA